MSYAVAELQRKLAGMIQITTITSVDHANKKLRVRLGADESAELPWPAIAGRNFVAWRPLRVGQQLILLSPNGDPAQGVVVGELYSQAVDAPSTDDAIDLIQFNNGNLIEHNMNTGKFRIIGDIELDGTLTASTDVVAKNISLVGHDHARRVGNPV